MLRANSPVTPTTGRGTPASGVSSTSSRLDAGSVLTRSTLRPRSASATAVAHATLVLPTPPLPVKKRLRGARSRRSMGAPSAAARLALHVRAWAATARRRWRCHIQLLHHDSGESRERFARWVRPLDGHAIVDHHQRQHVSATLERGLHCARPSKGCWLLREVEALHLDALLLQPVHVGGKARELRIDAGAADTSRATHSGIENANGHGHGELSFVSCR